MTVYARSGMKGHNVERWQQAINKVRGSIKLKTPLVADGAFGPKTLKATIAIQRVLNLKPDGIVGDGTKRAFKKRWPMVALGFVNPKAPQIKFFDKESKKSTAITKAKAKAAKKATVKQTVYAPPKPTFRPPLIRPPVTTVKPPPAKEGMGMIVPIIAIGAIGYLSMKG